MRVPRIDPEAFGALAERFVALHRSVPVPQHIRNLHAGIEALRVDGVSLPVSVHDAARRGDAWICSPVTSYSDYAAEEIERFGHPALTRPLRALALGFGAWMRRAGLDGAVSVNNWLVSTNAYPDLPAASIRRIADAARARWPTHAIWFRSLNRAHTAAWLDALDGAGARLIPSRQVYLYERVDRLAARHSDLKRDLRLLARNDMRPCPPGTLDAADYARIAELYGLLYLVRYSRLNPDYSAALMRDWHALGLLELHGARDERGVLNGVVGLLRFGDLITAPILGYDIALPARAGLYRRLTATALDCARRDDALVNLSAGAAHFKRQRGGVPAIEYSAVLDDHLPTSARRALGVLGAATRGIGVPIMERYRL